VNKITGNKGEAIALNYLIENGYKILATNWRFKYSEVDIIASKNNYLHFVEVKTRRSSRYGNPEESITAKKMQKLKEAAAEYQFQYPEWKYIQFDVIAIVLEQEIPKEITMFNDVYF
jgi:putative endonuclease